MPLAGADKVGATRIIDARLDVTPHASRMPFGATMHELSPLFRLTIVLSIEAVILSAVVPAPDDDPSGSVVLVIEPREGGVDVRGVGTIKVIGTADEKSQGSYVGEGVAVRTEEVPAVVFYVELFVRCSDDSI